MADDDLASVEHALASHPDYGDAAAITLKATEFYRFAVDLLSERSATVDKLASGLRDRTGQIPAPVVEDPLVRVTLDEAVSRLEQGFLDEDAWSEVVTMLRLVTDALDRAGAPVPPTGAQASNGLTVRTAPDREVWLWAADPDSRAPLARTFLATFTRDFLRGIPGRPVDPTPQAAARLEAGFGLLCELLPELGPGVGAHYAGIGVVDVRTEGETFLAGSVGRIPSVVFFSENRMAGPWRFAETALHEGLHLKLFDIQRSASVFAEPDRLPDGPKVEVPWLKWASLAAPNAWALDRALGAFHVYAHLGLFRRAVAARLTPGIRERFGEPEPNDPASLYRFATERTRYLGEEILRLGADALTDHGRTMVTWLLETAGRIPDTEAADA